MVLESQATDVDFAYYRSQLKNQSVIDEIEKSMKSYQIKKVDVSRQIKAIESFEATAVKSAEETKGMVEKELKDLDATLQNIQGARPFEDLTVVCGGGGAMRDLLGHSRVIAASEWMLMNLYRTRLWLLSLRLRSVLRSLFPTTDGCRPGTRYGSLGESANAIWLLTTSAGEVR